MQHVGSMLETAARIHTWLSLLGDLNSPFICSSNREEIPNLRDKCVHQLHLCFRRPAGEYFFRPHSSPSRDLGSLFGRLCAEEEEDG